MYHYNIKIMLANLATWNCTVFLRKRSKTTLVFENLQLETTQDHIYHRKINQGQIDSLLDTLHVLYQSKYKLSAYSHPFPTVILSTNICASVMVCLMSYHGQQFFSIMYHFLLGSYVVYHLSTSCSLFHIELISVFEGTLCCWSLADNESPDQRM